MKKKKLLVNYVYWQPVGHAIEAIRYTLGYQKANPDWEISLVLNKYTAVVLAELCPWIKNIYAVDIKDDNVKVTEKLFAHIPKDWDYLVSDHRSRSTDYCPGAFFKYYQLMGKYLNVKYESDYCGGTKVGYARNYQLLFSLPKENLVFADNLLIKTKINIALMLAGNKDVEFFPSLDSWKKIINTLYKTYGDDLSIYLIGKLAKSDKQTSSGVERKVVDEILKTYPRSVDCFDLGLLNQLAIIKGCDVFISPHSGFGFAVLCVNTPWLTISGGTWPEYFYNGVPFYSVLPDPKKYPCYREKNDFIVQDVDGSERIASMTVNRVNEDLGKITKAADVLINKKWNFEECLVFHLKEMEQLYPDKIVSFDNVHEKYVKGRYVP